MAKTKPSRLARELLETAEDMHRVRMMDPAIYEKITLRHLGPKNNPKMRHRRRAPAASERSGSQARSTAARRPQRRPFLPKRTG